MFLVKNEDIKKHKGEYLNWVVRKKGIKIKVLTELAGYDRSTFYNHIKNPNLPYSVMARYGKALNHDFLAEYPEFQNSHENMMLVISTFEEMEQDRDKWRSKYLAVSDLLHQCLQEKNKR